VSPETTPIPGDVQAAPASTPAPQSYVDPGDPAHYLNRELSWLEFNARVLAEAGSAEVPLFERLKFLGIFFSNLDEFFMVRVAGLQAQTQRTIAELPPDGLTPHEQLVAISQRAHSLMDAAYKLWHGEMIPALRRAGIVIVRPEELAPPEQAALDERFRTDIFPVLTPLAIDPGHPFPHLRNKSINLGIMFSREHEGQEPGFGVIQVPAMLSRLLRVRVEGAVRAFVLLEDVIARHVKEFFPAARLRGTYAFRVTRNWDLEIDEEEGEDLLLTIQAELRRRDRGNAVRVEIVGDGVEASAQRLSKALHVDPVLDVFRVPGPLYITDLAGAVADDDRREHRDEPFSPQVSAPLREADDIFAVIRERDVLLHHPYDSFDPVVELVSRAADDPNVLAIKQTLYRTGGDSPIVKHLARAAENGKQVTAIVELKARFDEASNIQWARTLEQSGAQVIYGLLGLKTHAKALLVVRREKADRLRRYVHLSTGNYNPQTARLYTDLGLFTAQREIGEDVTSLFNLLTGYSAPPRWNRLVVAPLGLHEAILGLIAREAQHARAGRKAQIIAQMNSLVDVDVIDALYGASQAGVEIKLAIRGICCLKPGLPGLSEGIHVRALIDRYLEHERVFRFANGGAEEVYISSADWMPRNFHRRVEVLIPILDAALREKVVSKIEVLFQDTAKTWELGRDGAYTRIAVPAGATPVRAQQRFMGLARERAKQIAEPLARSGRFHVLLRPPVETQETRAQVKEKKKKRALT
jgi:polyphosphate kinase